MLIGSDQNFSSISSSYNEQRTLTDVVMAANPIIVPTGSQGTSSVSQQVSYPLTTYPTVNAEYSSTQLMDGYKIVCLNICPYRYDATNKILNFISSINISLSLMTTATAKQATTTVKERGDVMKDAVKNFVINSNDLDSLYSTALSSSSLSTTSNEVFPYLIITSTSLKTAFEPLLEWKKMKGVKTKIITIDDINSSYSGSNTQLKIKNCLYDYYQNYGLKYVLLGGDDSVVPVQGCYCKVNSTVDNKIPTDLFYECFDDNFEWNANNNGIIGEISDNIDMSPEIYLTRAPVRTVSDVTSFVDKIIDYEKTPPVEDWKDSILLCAAYLWGTVTDDNGNVVSDGQYKSEKFYNTYIKPDSIEWKGTPLHFYDTMTDFAGGSDYALDSANLQHQLSEGYLFVDFATHGSQTLWGMESGTYNSSEASQLYNTQPTIITTMACLTNAFDSGTGGTEDPCLSEAFIRSSHSGVVAYLGCSRYGWGYSGYMSKYLGPSLQYNGIFYNLLFSQNQKNKNFGMLVAQAKSNMISQSSQYNAFRWVQLGLNPIGDPEMPIYTSRPKTISTAYITKCDSVINVKTGLSESKICIMSRNDDGDSYYKVDTTSYNTDVTFQYVPESFNICITKQNYIPLLLTTSNLTYIQNSTFNENHIISADSVVIGSKVTTIKSFGPVIVNSGSTTVNASKLVKICSNFKVNKGATFKADVISN